MEPVDVRRYVAPCGALCYSCVAFGDGPVAWHARALARRLEGFERLVATFATFEPRANHFDAFRQFLSYLAEGTCKSCREGGACMPDCGVRACSAERGHDYCFQCPDFPCDQTGLDDALRAYWLHANRRMAEIGPQAYWQEGRDRSHYAGD
jgi:hypothetical protein